MGMVAAPAPWSGCETGLSCGTHSTGQPGAHASWGRHVRAHLLERPAQPVSRGGGLPAGVREIGQPRGPAGGRQGTGWRRGDCLLGVREIGQPWGPAGGLRGTGWRRGTACWGGDRPTPGPCWGSAGHGLEVGDCLPGVSGAWAGDGGLPALAGLQSHAGGRRGADWRQGTARWGSAGRGQEAGLPVATAVSWAAPCLGVSAPTRLVQRSWEFQEASALGPPGGAAHSVGGSLLPPLPSPGPARRAPGATLRVAAGFQKGVQQSLRGRCREMGGDGERCPQDPAHGQPMASLGPWRPTSEEACPCPAHWGPPLTVPLAPFGDGVVCPSPAAPGGAILPLPGGRGWTEWGPRHSLGAWGSRFPASLETVSDRCFSLTIPEELSWRSQEAGRSHLPTCPQDPEEARVPPLGSRASSTC